MERSRLYIGFWRESQMGKISRKTKTFVDIKAIPVTGLGGL
jgi:hypothetical protein